MAVDQTVSSPADPTVVSDPNIIPPTQSAGLDPNRPDSTISADSSAQPQPSPADSGSDYTQAQPTVPADSSQTPADSSQTLPADSTASVSDPSQLAADSQIPVPAESPSPPSDVPAPIPTDTGAQTDSAPSSSAPPPTVEPPPVVSPEPPEATSRGSIRDSLSPDQPIQVQPVALESAPSPQASQTPETAPQSAGIKPEPPQGTQNAPSADSNSQKSSFGDILVGVGRPSPAPSPTPTQAPAPVPKPPVPPPTAPVASPPSPISLKSSFGDLIGKQPDEPTINIEPIQPPKEEKPTPPNPSVPPSPPPSQLSDDKLKAEVETRRQKATQIRKQKHDEHLAKTLSFVQQKGKVKNEDVRDYLHVSQTTATDYLHTLVKQGKIKKEGKGKATVYSLT